MNSRPRNRTGTPRAVVDRGQTDTAAAGPQLLMNLLCGPELRQLSQHLVNRPALPGQPPRGQIRRSVRARRRLKRIRPGRLTPGQLGTG